MIAIQLILKHLVISQLINHPEESVVTVVPPTDEPSEEEIGKLEGESATEEVA